MGDGGDGAKRISGASCWTMWFHPVTAEAAGLSPVSRAILIDGTVFTLIQAVSPRTSSSARARLQLWPPKKAKGPLGGAALPHPRWGERGPRGDEVSE